MQKIYRPVTNNVLAYGVRCAARMIHLQEVTKDFAAWRARLRRRHIFALDGISLDVPAGTAMGIVGPNGAGKSTLLRLLLGYLRPTRGAVRIGGLSPRAYAERHGIGYVPERVAVPPRWSVRQALRAYAALGEVEPASERVDDGLRRMGLVDVADRQAGALSKGNLQRLAIAQALLGDRAVMILDEPTDGLDPQWTARLRDALAAWRQARPERVLLFASHDLDEVERIADRVVVLGNGRVRQMIDLRGAANAAAYQIDLGVLTTDARAVVQRVFPGAVPLSQVGTSYRVTATELPALNRGLAALLEQGITLRSLTREGLPHLYQQCFADEPEAATVREAGP